MGLPRNTLENLILNISGTLWDLMDARLVRCNLRINLLSEQQYLMTSY